MTKKISANRLQEMVNGNSEFALIDVREEGVFGACHILLCANIPLSQLELKIEDQVPRKTTPIVLCDGGEGLVDKAATRLAGFGYTDIKALDGGIPSWQAAGLEVFSGLNVPSKAFGEFVEHVYGTPSISANELKKMMESDQKLIVLDSRPIEEFRVMNIPTGIDMPGAELVHRVQEVAPDLDTTIVVNCAGRTRSIIGAQSLINAEIPNKVVALRNGTMGWQLAGYELESGSERSSPGVSEAGHKTALRRAKNVGKRFGVKLINSQILDKWRSHKNDRTLHILDVRTKAEFETGHIADSRHAPGGQLVQATDIYVATQNARIVLVDDMLVRALMTASWLIQLAWCEVYVLESGLSGQPIVAGPRLNPCFGLDIGNTPTVNASEALQLQSKGAMLIDLQRSLGYREKHPKGAWFGIRTGLEENIKKQNFRGTLILTSPDGRLAALAATDLVLHGFDACAINGGTTAWESARLPMEGGMTNLLSTPTDAYLRAYDRIEPKEIEKAMNAYLEWEIGLVDQIRRPGGITFEIFPE